MQLGLGVEEDAGEAAVGRGDEQRADRRLDDVEADVEQALRGCGLAEAAVEIRRDGHGSSRFSGNGAQAPDAGRGGLAGGLGRGVQRDCDVVVGKVVGVAEHERRTLGRRQAVGEVLDLRVGGTPVLDGQLRQLVRRRARAPARVDREPGGDRQHPGAQVLAVLEPVVGAERAQERLLESVLGRLPAHPLAEEAEDDVAVLDVETLERGDRGHCFHHPL